MTARLTQSPASRRDFIRHFVNISREAGPDVADRFRLAVDQTYANLPLMPLAGSPREIAGKVPKVIRLWPVKGFRNYWIAYVPLRGGVSIRRLFHAKEDYTRIIH